MVASLFVCQPNLEVVSSLNEKALQLHLTTIARFCARRGRPAKMFTKNETNFIASRSDLDFFFNSNNFTQVIKQSLSLKRIQWLVVLSVPHTSAVFGEPSLSH